MTAVIAALAMLVAALGPVVGHAADAPEGPPRGLRGLPNPDVECVGECEMDRIADKLYGLKPVPPEHYRVIGSNGFDRVYTGVRDGKPVLVIGEAKGGGSRLGSRTDPVTGAVYEQGSQGWMRLVLDDMDKATAKLPATHDSRKLIADLRRGLAELGDPNNTNPALQLLASRAPLAQIRTGAGGQRIPGRHDTRFTIGPPEPETGLHPPGLRDLTTPHQIEGKTYHQALPVPPGAIGCKSPCRVGSRWAEDAIERARQRPEYAKLVHDAGINPGYTIPLETIYSEQFRIDRRRLLEAKVSAQIDPSRQSALTNVVTQHYGKEEAHSLMQQQQFWAANVAPNADARNKIVRSRAMLDDLRQHGHALLRDRLLTASAFSNAAWAYYEGDLNAAVKQATRDAANDMLVYALEQWAARGSVIAQRLLGVVAPGILGSIALGIVQEIYDIGKAVSTAVDRIIDESAHQLYVDGPMTFFDFLLEVKGVKASPETLYMTFGATATKDGLAQDLNDAIVEFSTWVPAGARAEHWFAITRSRDVFDRIRTQAQHDFKRGILRGLAAHTAAPATASDLSVFTTVHEHRASPSVLVLNARVDPAMPRPGDRVTLKADVVVYGLPSQTSQLVIRQRITGPAVDIALPETRRTLDFIEDAARPDEVTRIETVEQTFMVDECHRPGSYRYDVSVAADGTTLDAFAVAFTVTASPLQEAIEGATAASGRAAAAAQRADAAAANAAAAAARVATALDEATAALAAARDAGRRAASVAAECRSARTRADAIARARTTSGEIAKRLTTDMDSARATANTACELAQQIARTQDPGAAAGMAARAQKAYDDVRALAAAARGEAAGLRRLTEDARRDSEALETVSRHVRDLNAPRGDATARVQSARNIDPAAAMAEIGARRTEARAAASDAANAAREVGTLLDRWVKSPPGAGDDPVSPCLTAKLEAARRLVTAAAAAAAGAAQQVTAIEGRAAGATPQPALVASRLADAERALADIDQTLRGCTGIGTAPEGISDLSAAADAAEVTVPRVDTAVSAAQGCAILAAESAKKKGDVAAAYRNARGLLADLQTAVGRAVQAAGETEAARQEMYNLAAASLAAVQAAQGRVRAAEQSRNLCAEGGRIMAALVQLAQTLNATGQRVDYDRRATQMYGTTICQLTQQAQLRWSQGARAQAYNLSANARQWAPYLEQAAGDGRQYAEQARQWAQQAQAAHARLVQILNTMNQLAAGAGANAGAAETQRARFLLDGGGTRQAAVSAAGEQARGRRQQIAALVQTAGGDPEGLVTTADQWLARVPPAQAATTGAVQQMTANYGVVDGNWKLVRANDTAVLASLRACGNLGADPINDLLAAAATIDAEYQAMIGDFTTAQNCRATAAAIEGAAGQGPPPQQPPSRPATTTPQNPPSSTTGTRCPDGTMSLLGVCSGMRR